ncbi:MAG: hypothetical protein AB4290_10990 [Spirulina sp.]
MQLEDYFDFLSADDIRIKIWGLLWIRPNFSFREIAETIYLIWEVSDTDEWLNKLDWIPFDEK